MRRAARLLLFLGAISGCSRPYNTECEPQKGRTYLLSDKDFQQQYGFNKLWEFVQSYPKNQLTKNQVSYLNQRCSNENVSPLFILFKAQFETGMLANNDGNYRYKWREDRFLCYGLHKSKVKNGRRYYPYHGYSNQVYYAVRQFRNNFDNFTPGMIKKLEHSKDIIKPENAATWAIYEYTPFFDTHPIYGWSLKPVGMVAGNDIFIKYYAKYKNKINSVGGIQ